jgi:diguanylate cyclase (GGDEF)-like protein
VLPHTDEAGAMVIAERIRQAMRGQLASPDGSPIAASFGTAAYPDHGTDVDILLSAADQALYAAKSAGRDRTVAFVA